MLIEIDMKRHKVLEYELARRWDLSPPAVGIVVSTNTWMYLPVWSKTTSPQNAKLAQVHALVTQFSASSTGATVADVPETSSEEEEPTEEEVLERTSNRELKYNRPEVITRGVELPKTGEKFIEFIKSHDPNLANANIRAGNNEPKITVVPQNGAQGAGYSATATQYQLVYGEIGNKVPGLKWGEVLIQMPIIHEGTPPAELAEYFPTPYDQTNHYWGWIGVKTITTNRKGYRVPVGAEHLAEPIEEDEEEEEEDDEPPDFANDYVPPLVETSYQSVVDGLYNSLSSVPFEGEIVLLDFGGSIPQTGDAIRILNGEPEWADMSQTVIQSVNYDIVSRKTTIKFGPPDHLRPSQNKDQQEYFSEMAEETKEEEEEEEQEGLTWETQADYEPKQKMQMPGVGPRSEVIKGSYSTYLDLPFAIRIVFGLDNQPVKAQVKKGIVYVTEKAAFKEVGNNEWNDFPVGSEIWCNINVDINGVITSAVLSTAQGSNTPYRIKQDENGFVDGGYGPGSYSIRIGMASVPRPDQKQPGPIYLSYGIGTVIIGNGPA